MAQRVILTGKKDVKTRSLLTALLTVSATLFLLLSLASATYAIVGDLSKVDTITGKIAAVDATHTTNILTLQSSELGFSAPNNEMNILVGGNTPIMMCGASGSIKDLKPGSKMQVTYHEVAGLAVADFIDKPC